MTMPARNKKAPAKAGAVPSRPDWRVWNSMADVPLTAALFLSIGVNPDEPVGDQALQEEMDYRARVAHSHAKSGTLPTRKELKPYHAPLGIKVDPETIYHVKLEEFRAWAESLPTPFSFSEEFPSPPPAHAASTETPLETKERTSLLRIIHALAAMAELPASGYASSIERQLQELGYEGPKERTIRNVIAKARESE